MATYNGTLKKWNQTGAAWDILYPKTTAENIISGELALARVPVLTEDKIPTLNASKIGAGTIDAARLPAIAITNSVTYTTMTTFLAAYQANHDLVQLGDVVILTTDKKTYIHNGGTAWTAADLTLLQTPTDLVTSVNGYVGVVSLDGSNIAIEGYSGNYYGNQDSIAESLNSVDAQVAANATAINLKANKVSITGATKAKITYNAEGIVTAGADLVEADIPTLGQSKITNLTTDLAAKANKVTITGATKAKITYNADGIVTAGADLAATDIPALATSKITGLDTALAAKAPLLEPVFVNNNVADFISTFNGIAGSLNYLSFKLAGVEKAAFLRDTLDNFTLTVSDGKLKLNGYDGVQLQYGAAAQCPEIYMGGNTYDIFHEGNFDGMYLLDELPGSPRDGQVVFEY